MKVAGSIPDAVTGIFHWQPFRPRCGPEVDSACNRNEYQEYFLGGKSGRCVGLTTLPPSCAFCIKIPVTWTSWALRACTGILPLTLPLPLPLLFGLRNVLGRWQGATVRCCRVHSVPLKWVWDTHGTSNCHDQLVSSRIIWTCSELLLKSHCLKNTGNRRKCGTFIMKNKRTWRIKNCRYP
jgi:hypothetical protein